VGSEKPIYSFLQKMIKSIATKNNFLEFLITNIFTLFFKIIKSKLLFNSASNEKFWILK
jgi:hypothetical protein